MKYFGVNLMTYVSDLHNENHETILREIQDDLNNGGIYYVNELEDIMFLSCQFYLNSSVDSMQP